MTFEELKPIVSKIILKENATRDEKLKEIWKIAANTSNEYLTKDEFYVALRLIAYA